MGDEIDQCAESEEESDETVENTNEEAQSEQGVLSQLVRIIRSGDNDDPKDDQRVRRP